MFDRARWRMQTIEPSARSHCQNAATDVQFSRVRFVTLYKQFIGWPCPLIHHPLQCFSHINSWKFCIGVHQSIKPTKPHSEHVEVMSAAERIQKTFDIIAFHGYQFDINFRTEGHSATFYSANSRCYWLRHIFLWASLYRVAGLSLINIKLNIKCI